jgi:hypothetical protein
MQETTAASLTSDAAISLPRDLKEAAATLGRDEARFLVDLYYQMQDNRIRAAAQERQLRKTEEPHETLAWFTGQAETLENQVKRALDSYSSGQPLGEWAKSIYGIGPVIAAGLLAHIDIEKAPTVGHIWAFAGLDPTRKWDKGAKRPHNAALKRLCWIAGESFKRFSAHEDCVYGHAYRDRKAYEVARDERGGNAEWAAKSLAERKIQDKALRETYESGHLPAGRLDLRATRWAVKLFLAHYHHVGYVLVMGKEPPKPYVIEHLGHVDYTAPPNFP